MQLLQPRTQEPAPPSREVRFATVGSHHGILPLFAFTAVAADNMTCAIEFATFGAGLVFSLIVAFAIFWIGLALQRHGAKDGWALSFGKAAAVALLTAIPTSLPSFVVAAWGLGSYLASRARLRPNRDDAGTSY